jgi:CheY-like chemotaxis protein
MLIFLGYQVKTAVNGFEAVDLYQKHKLQLILMVLFFST